MSPQNNNNTDTPSAAEPSSPAAFDIEALSPRQQRVVLVCDVVESVRWMEHDEDNAITRWSQFATAVRSRIAPAHGGEVIKSMGDGLMMQFQAAPGAIAAANAMQKIASEGNQGFPPERQMHLRIGIHQTEARRDAHDLYGHGVNLAARITTLAGPGEIIVTPEVRDHLTDSLDGEIEDMGECYLKHLSEPQRVYKITELSASLITPKSVADEVELSTRIAVLHFDDTHVDASGLISGLVADGLIDVLSRQSHMKVISKLTSSQLSKRNQSVAEIGKILCATYVLSGSIYSSRNKYLVCYELASVKNQAVLLCERYEVTSADLMAVDSAIFHQVAHQIRGAITEEEYRQTQIYPLPSLASYSLLLGGIKSMHQTSKEKFTKSYELLDHLVQRHPKAPIALSWLAKWHVLSAVRGLTIDIKKSTNQSLRCTATALDLWPDCSLALAMEGFIYTHMIGDLDKAKNCLDQAIEINSSESLAWLFRSVVNSMRSDHKQSITDCATAKLLSPYDPLKYFFDSLEASAYLADQQQDKAIESSVRSLKLNRFHSPTLRVLLTAQYEKNRIEDAQKTLALLLQEQPSLSLNSYLGSSNSVSDTKRRCANAMRALGLK